MKATHLFVGAVLTACCVHASAGIDVIATYEMTVNGPIPSAGSPTWDLYFATSDPQLPDPTGLLSGATLDFADFVMGTQLMLTGDLAGAAAILTNGLDSDLWFGSTVVGAPDHLEMISESLAFAGDGLMGPDLAGYTLTGVSVMGTSFQSGLDDYDATFQFAFHGVAIPAPGAMGVFAMAGFGGMRRRR